MNGHFTIKLMIKTPVDPRVIDNQRQMEPNPDGRFDSWRARLVVREYTQDYNIDYYDRPSSVVKLSQSEHPNIGSIGTSEAELIQSEKNVLGSVHQLSMMIEANEHGSSNQAYMNWIELL